MLNNLPLNKGICELTGELLLDFMQNPLFVLIT